MNSTALKNLRRAAAWAFSEPSKFRLNHKGSMGRIGIIGGCELYSGAPYFSAISSMRIGADLAYVICPSSASNAIKCYSPELIVMPFLDEKFDKHFDQQADKVIQSLHAIVVGPGLGPLNEDRDNRVIKLIERAIKRSIPIVVDAEGIDIISNNLSLLSSYPRSILTPNRKEFQRLLKTQLSIDFSLDNHDINEVQALVKKLSNKIKIPILLKGPTDFIVEPSKNFMMTTDCQLGSTRRCGGQGDILAGITAVFMNWLNHNYYTEEDTVWAAFFASSILKHCNSLAYEKKKNGFVCSDMIELLQEAFDVFKCKITLKANKEATLSNFEYDGVLTCNEIQRYQRQMLVNQLGLEGQIKLKQSSVLIVGGGGLGCPSSIYLAGSGIGRIGIVDDDLVEESNLHRQILHSVKKVGILKVESIKQSLMDINPNVIVDIYPEKLTRYNAVEIVEQYEIVLDASDNLPTRHMINDACVFAKKPLVSGAALRTDGQLSVYNYDESTPCFRCLFPKPINTGAVGSCSEQGVIGTVPGLIGVLQAYEVIKIASGASPSYAKKLLFYSGIDGDFKVLQLADRNPSCASCGNESKLTRQLMDYDQFLNNQQCTINNPPQQTQFPRVSLQEYKKMLQSKAVHLLVDVRPQPMYKASHFKHAISLPLNEIIENESLAKQKLQAEMDKKLTRFIVVVCRKGISSVRAAQIIASLFSDNKEIVVKDLEQGMTGWAKVIDNTYACL